MLYGHVMDTLVTQWRKRWHEGDFPFYVVQLPGQANVSNNPLVREQQAKILSLHNTGMAVVLDTGEIHNVHPKNKEPLGDALSRIALANVYGRKIEFSGPVYASSKSREPRSASNSPTPPDSSPRRRPAEVVSVAGADHKFVDADARIVGDSVVVSSPMSACRKLSVTPGTTIPKAPTYTTPPACRPHPSAPTIGMPCPPSTRSSPAK